MLIGQKLTTVTDDQSVIDTLGVSAPPEGAKAGKKITFQDVKTGEKFTGKISAIVKLGKMTLIQFNEGLTLANEEK